jgi:hypothetical protein
MELLCENVIDLDYSFRTQPAVLTVPKGFGKGSSIHTEQNYVIFTSVSHIELNLPDPKGPYAHWCN